MNASWLPLLWLLLPVAAASGWWAARRTTAAHNGATARIDPEYFKGLNYVLNEQPDKAIEVFVRMVEVDNETVETHLALGNLFRRRGEVDRAIRVHQNLIGRDSLTRDQRALALYELGMDYMRSGLLDRAEGLFRELADVGSYQRLALEQLLDIYQQEKDWNNAIAAARRLGNGGNRVRAHMIAQFHCELAVAAQIAGQDQPVARHIADALQIDPDCVRASILEAEMRTRSGAVEAAIESYRRIEQQDAEYLPEIIAPLYQCYREVQRTDEFQGFLKSIIERHGGITPLLFHVDLVAAERGQEAAIRYISGELRRRPTVRGVNRLIDFLVRTADGENAENLRTIKDLLFSLSELRPVYRCTHCGFAARRLHWQCPGCKRWNKVKPVHGVEGE